MIQLSNISKKFGETQAVEGISLMIPDGSVFGLLFFLYMIFSSCHLAIDR